MQNKLPADSHTHTLLCLNAVGEPEQYIGNSTKPC